MESGSKQQEAEKVSPTLTANNGGRIEPSTTELRTVKRNGKIVAYDENKVKVAITKAFLAVEGGSAAASSRIHDIVNRLSAQITATFKRRSPGGATIHIEDIQDQVELILMRAGEHKVARAYVLYREAHRQAREAQGRAQNAMQSDEGLLITLPDGNTQSLEMPKLLATVKDACRDLSGVCPQTIVNNALRHIVDRASLSELHQALVSSARELTEKEPNHCQINARLLLNQLQSEALFFIGLPFDVDSKGLKTLYPQYFQHCIHKGIELGHLDPKLSDFDLVKLGQAIKPERDQLIDDAGLETLYQDYFLKHQQQHYELPQAFFMRVAMGLALRELNKEERAIEFYQLLSSLDFMCASPVLFNSATTKPQLSSGYLSTLPDKLEGIYSSLQDNALLSKYMGGIGNDWSHVRAKGSEIQGIQAHSPGIIPFLKVAGASTVAVDQAGKRAGAVCAYLECWHLDIEEFLELQQNRANTRDLWHAMQTAHWIPDLFMKRLQEDADWTLFSPNDVPDLHALYGKAFEQAYIAYEEKAALGLIKHSKTLPAKQLWHSMLRRLCESGQPWINFKVPCNARSTQQHVGVIHCSDIDTALTLNTSSDEVAVCCLGSINLPAHIDEQGLNIEKLERTVKTAVRMLDNIIDINYYAIPEARHANLRHRPIGLGIMGFEDALFNLDCDFASWDAVEFADHSTEFISYYAIKASSQLAQERGTYSSYEGSLWSQGILPIDSMDLLHESRHQWLSQDRNQALDWDDLRTRVRTVGMRNSNVLAITSDTELASICGVTASTEPSKTFFATASSAQGLSQSINLGLVDDLKKRQLWDEVMVNDLKYYRGSIQSIERIPESLKQRYKTAYEIDPEWLIEAASRRQKWLDQSQSLHLFVKHPSEQQMDTIYRLAWLRGLKTTGELHSFARSEVNQACLSEETYFQGEEDS